MAGPLLRADQVAGAGDWPADRASSTVVLDYDSRHRRRIRLSCEDGTPFLLDLEKAIALRDGDGLAVEDGSWIAVRAAAERLVEITCSSARNLQRVAWHLGNRHCPAAIETGRILIRRDHVIEDMLKGLGAWVREVNEPFDPERGAYDDQNVGRGHIHE